MTYLKSLFGGLVGLVLFVFLFLVIEILVISRHTTGLISLDIVRFVRWPPVWIGAFVSFVGTFYWIHRRSLHRL